MPYEYSKRFISKLLVFLLTLIVALRLINLPETEKWEVIVLVIVCVQLLLLYYFYYDNSLGINILLMFFSLSYYSYYKNIFVFASALGIVIAKLFEKSIQFENKKYFLLLMILASNFLLWSINNSFLESIYMYINNQIYDNFKVKFPEIFERMCITPEPIEDFYIARMLEFFKKKLFFK